MRGGKRREEEDEEKDVLRAARLGTIGVSGNELATPARNEAKSTVSIVESSEGEEKVREKKGKHRDNARDRSFGQEVVPRLVKNATRSTAPSDRMAMVLYSDLLKLSEGVSRSKGGNDTRLGEPVVGRKLLELGNGALEVVDDALVLVGSLGVAFRVEGGHAGSCGARKEVEMASDAAVSGR